MGKTKGMAAMSAIELLSLIGFALCFGWAFVAFFWLFCDYPAQVPVGVRDLTQLAVFAGICAGFVILNLLGRIERFSPFSVPVLACTAVCAIALPAASFAMYRGVFMPLWTVCALNVGAGLAGSVLIVSWLDVLSRLRTNRYGRFTGLSFTGGAMLFALVTTAPESMQPLFATIYALCSLALLVYATRNADANEERAPMEAIGEKWRFTKEIEPSFFLFGLIFALGFVFLFNNGKDYVLIGLLSVIPGALAIAVVSGLERESDITVTQRFLMVISVLSCVLLPFAHGWLQLACACLTVAAWALFKSVNYAFVVKKSALLRTTPFYRQAPMRLCVSTLGFTTGWAVAAVTTFMLGEHAEAFTTIRMVAACVLVLVVMAFYPVSKHHPVDGQEETESTPSGTVIAVSMDESELFDRRCTAVAKLYQLSPREADILVFLAKGRNAAWIQEKLVISPHTVKSHIYNIYRKLDIHSQQKLMSFVEEFPLDF